MDTIKSPLIYLFASVHMGPYLTIQSLEAALGIEKICHLVDGISKETRSKAGLAYLDLEVVEKHWTSLPELIERTGIKAVIRSTSEDATEPNVETKASLAAAEAGIPVFVIEDFPGNYWPQCSEKLDGLFVEDDSIIELHCNRGVDPSVVHNSGNPRYDTLANHDRHELAAQVRGQLRLGDEKVVLWAGQPNGDDSYHALTRLIENFPDEQFTLLFKAHPRDKAYSEGQYLKILAKASVTVLDVTANSNALGLYCASDLVVTQFSSAGVEASYMGVPTLYALFDDLGKRYLMAQKGYASLPWFKENCSFVIEKEDEIKGMLEVAIFDEFKRETVRSNFQSRFVSEKNSIQTIAAHIGSAVA